MRSRRRLHALRRRLRPVPAPPAAPPALPAGTSPQDARILTAALPFTMTSPERLQALVDAVRYCEARGLPGAYAECGGVARRLGAGDPADAARARGRRPRRARLRHVRGDDRADRARRLGARGARAGHLGAGAGRGRRPWDDLFDPATFNEEAVRATLLETGYPPSGCTSCAGPSRRRCPPRRRSASRSCGSTPDWYASTRHELEHLYPRLCPGGVLIVDDYGHWDGARRAVDEHFAAAGPAPLLTRIDYTGRLAIKAVSGHGVPRRCSA
jgi:hypothetical protein